jgi:hypothetical protein
MKLLQLVPAAALTQLLCAHCRNELLYIWLQCTELLICMLAYLYTRSQQRQTTTAIAAICYCVLNIPADTAAAAHTALLPTALL